MILKPLTDHKWEGYTLEELQEQMLLNDVRIARQKRELVRKFKTEKKKEKADGGWLSMVAPYLEYFAMAMAIFGKIRKIYQSFRKPG